MGYTKKDLISYGNAFLSPAWSRKTQFRQLAGDIGQECFVYEVFDTLCPEEFGIHESMAPDALYENLDLQSFCEYLESDYRAKSAYQHAVNVAGDDAALAYDLFDQAISSVSDADFANWINELVKSKEFTKSDMVAFAEWLYKNSSGQEFEYIASNGTSCMEKRGEPVHGFIEDRVLKCFGRHFFLPSRDLSAWDVMLDIEDMGKWAKYLYSINGSAYRNVVSDAEIENFLNQDI